MTPGKDASGEFLGTIWRRERRGRPETFAVRKRREVPDRLIPLRSFYSDIAPRSSCLTGSRPSCPQQDQRDRFADGYEQIRSTGPVDTVVRERLSDELWPAGIFADLDALKFYMPAHGLIRVTKVRSQQDGSYPLASLSPSAGGPKVASQQRAFCSQVESLGAAEMRL